jgi:hypothetical protein
VASQQPSASGARYVTLICGNVTASRVTSSRKGGTKQEHDKDDGSGCDALQHAPFQFDHGLLLRLMHSEPCYVLQSPSPSVALLPADLDINRAFSYLFLISYLHDSRAKIDVAWLVSTASSGVCCVWFADVVSSLVSPGCMDQRLTSQSPTRSGRW